MNQFWLSWGVFGGIFWAYLLISVWLLVCLICVEAHGLTLLESFVSGMLSFTLQWYCLGMYNYFGSVSWSDYLHLLEKRGCSIFGSVASSPRKGYNVISDL